MLGHEPSVNHTEWPEWLSRWIAEDVVTIVVQVNGKLRGRVEVSREADKESVEEAAMALEPVKAQLEGRTLRKIIVVPGKLVNIVAN